MLPLLLGGAVLAGVGYGYFWGSWADCYGRMHPARTSFYLPVAFLLTAVLFLAVSLLSENLGVPAILLMVPLPVASFVCLSRCRAEVPDGRAAREGGTKRSMAALGSLLGLIIASLVLSCLFGFVWELTVFTVGSVNEAHLAPLVANLVVAVALAGLVLYARTRIKTAKSGASEAFASLGRGYRVGYTPINGRSSDLSSTGTGPIIPVDKDEGRFEDDSSTGTTNKTDWYKVLQKEVVKNGSTPLRTTWILSGSRSG